MLRFSKCLPRQRLPALLPLRAVPPACAPHTRATTRFSRSRPVPVYAIGYTTLHLPRATTPGPRSSPFAVPLPCFALRPRARPPPAALAAHLRSSTATATSRLFHVGPPPCVTHSSATTLLRLLPLCVTRTSRGGRRCCTPRQHYALVSPRDSPGSTRSRPACVLGRRCAGFTSILCGSARHRAPSL